MNLLSKCFTAAFLLCSLSACSKSDTIVDPGGNNNPTTLTTGSEYKYYFTTQNIFGEIVTRDTLLRTIGRKNLTIDGKTGATEIIQSLAGQFDTSYVATEANGDLSVWMSTLDENIVYHHWVTYPVVSKTAMDYTINTQGAAGKLTGTEHTSYVEAGNSTISGKPYDFSRVKFMASTELDDQGTLVTGSFDMNVDYSPTLLLPLSETGGNVLAPALLRYAKGTATFVSATVK